MKKIVPEYSFTEAQLHTIKALAEETGLTELTVRILFARGLDDVKKIRTFMNPSGENLLDPFLMKGMREAVEMITLARDEGRTVAVFGDYDADGVCASAIMYHALKAFGIEAHVYIPEREDGYGLSVEAVDRIFDECQPELFITVDCGISCAAETQYVYELGADVIVTDHHELPEVLPDTVIINPKLEDDYPYDNLCGAGVAFKLACALLGERAYSLIDFAALATVADSVPLLGENRDIVSEGLKIFNANPRSCFVDLLGKLYDGVTAMSLAFNVAPKINAAGRMGDAYAAYRLFIAEDENEIKALSTQLCAYNIERQKCCDELYASAKAKLREKGAYGSVIMLSDESWNSGFVGIVAAKIAEEFNRPTILFVRHGDMLKGSARSIEGINIFTALKNCSALIAEFGGHAQAAGINLEVNKFDDLERALDEELRNTYGLTAFEQRIFVSGEIDSPVPEKLAKEMAALEPYGVGHRKPLFALTAGACTARPIKFMSPHLVVKSDYIEMTYFSGLKNIKLIESDVKKTFVLELGVNKYHGREYVRGTVRDFVYDGRTGRRISERIFSNALLRTRVGDMPVEVETLTTEQTKALIEEKAAACPYGLCLVASDRRTLAKYDGLEKFGCDLFYPSTRNLANALIVSPAADADLSGYRDFVFLDDPADFHLTALSGRKAYVNGEINGTAVFSALDVSRDTLLDVFAALRREVNSLDGSTAEELAARSDGLGFDKLEFIFAINVFEELGLVSFDDGHLTVYRGVKADLRDSKIYRRVCELQTR